MKRSRTRKKENTKSLCFKLGYIYNIQYTWPLQIPSSDMQIFAYNHAQTCIYMHLHIYKFAPIHIYALLIYLLSIFLSTICLSISYTTNCLSDGISE